MQQEPRVRTYCHIRGCKRLCKVNYQQWCYYHSYAKNRWRRHVKPLEQLKAEHALAAHQGHFHPAKTLRQCAFDGCQVEITRRRKYCPEHAAEMIRESKRKYDRLYAPRHKKEIAKRNANFRKNNPDYYREWLDKHPGYMRQWRYNQWLKKHNLTGRTT